MVSKETTFKRAHDEENLAPCLIQDKFLLSQVTLALDCPSSFNFLSSTPFAHSFDAFTANRSLQAWTSSRKFCKCTPYAGNSAF